MAMAGSQCFAWEDMMAEHPKPEVGGGGGVGGNVIVQICGAGWGGGWCLWSGGLEGLVVTHVCTVVVRTEGPCYG